jgi:uncharacterized protein YceH (UPF0502 family)
VARTLGAVDLSDVEARVLGSLVEKQLTTPQQYPLTLNALVLACNQASNRDPVVAYDEPTVDAAVTSVKTKGLVSFVHPSHGRSALRYRHSLAEALGVAERPLALLAVLMLRGAQTPGELRARTERMVRFADLAEVEAELDALAARQEPLVVRLRRGAGQKEDRYEAALSPRSPGAAPPGPAPAAATVGPPSSPVSGPGAATRAAPGSVQSEVEALRADVAALRAEVESLRAALGG